MSTNGSSPENIPAVVIAMLARMAWLGTRSLSGAERLGAAIETPEEVGERLAHVRERQLEIGMAGKDAAEDDPQRVGSGLGGPTPKTG
jgi:hypothetical protein